MYDDAVFYAVAHSDRIVIEPSDSSTYFTAKTWLREHGVTGVIEYKPLYSAWGVRTTNIYVQLKVYVFETAPKLRKNPKVVRSEMLNTRTLTRMEKITTGRVSGVSVITLKNGWMKVITFRRFSLVYGLRNPSCYKWQLNNYSIYHMDWQEEFVSKKKKYFLFNVFLLSFYNQIVIIMHYD